MSFDEHSEGLRYEQVGMESRDFMKNAGTLLWVIGIWLILSLLTIAISKVKFC